MQCYSTVRTHYPPGRHPGAQAVRVDRVESWEAFERRTSRHCARRSRRATLLVVAVMSGLLPIGLVGIGVPGLAVLLVSVVTLGAGIWQGWSLPAPPDIGRVLGSRGSASSYEPGGVGAASSYSDWGSDGGG